MIELLILTFIVLSVICLWILIERRKSPKFLIWFIPVLLILTSSTYWTYTSILGYPKKGLPDEGLYISHVIDEPTWIYLWVVHKDNVPKSYQIPYKKPTHEQLEGVEKEVEHGKNIMVRVKQIGDGIESDGKKQAGFTVGGDLSFYEWDYKRNMPSKD